MKPLNTGSVSSTSGAQTYPQTVRFDGPFLNVFKNIQCIWINQAFFSTKIYWFGIKRGETRKGKSDCGWSETSKWDC